MTAVSRYHLENHKTSLRSKNLTTGLRPWKCTPFGAFGTAFPPEGEMPKAEGVYFLGR